MHLVGIAIRLQPRGICRVVLPASFFRPLAFVLLGALARAAEPDGALIFENNCASCHGLDGKARTPAGRKLGAHDLSESKYDDAALAVQIRQGVKTPQGVTKMPAFADRLKDEEISAVIVHVKKFRKK